MSDFNNLPQDDHNLNINQSEQQNINRSEELFRRAVNEVNAGANADSNAQANPQEVQRRQQEEQSRRQQEEEARQKRAIEVIQKDFVEGDLFKDTMYDMELTATSTTEIDKVVDEQHQQLHGKGIGRKKKKKRRAEFKEKVDRSKSVREELKKLSEVRDNKKYVGIDRELTKTEKLFMVVGIENSDNNQIALDALKSESKAQKRNCYIKLFRRFLKTDLAVFKYDHFQDVAADKLADRIQILDIADNMEELINECEKATGWPLIQEIKDDLKIKTDILKSISKPYRAMVDMISTPEYALYGNDDIKNMSVKDIDKHLANLKKKEVDRLLNGQPSRWDTPRFLEKRKYFEALKRYKEAVNESKNGSPRLLLRKNIEDLYDDDQTKTEKLNQLTNKTDLEWNQYFQNWASNIEEKDSNVISHSKVLNRIKNKNSLKDIYTKEFVGDKFKVLTKDYESPIKFDDKMNDFVFGMILFKSEQKKLEEDKKNVSREHTVDVLQTELEQNGVNAFVKATAGANINEENQKKEFVKQVEKVFENIGLADIDSLGLDDLQKLIKKENFDSMYGLVIMADNMQPVFDSYEKIQKENAELCTYDVNKINELKLKTRLLSDIRPLLDGINELYSKNDNLINGEFFNEILKKEESELDEMLRSKDKDTVAVAKLVGKIKIIQTKINYNSNRKTADILESMRLSKKAKDLFVSLKIDGNKNLMSKQDEEKKENLNENTITDAINKIAEFKVSDIKMSNVDELFNNYESNMRILDQIDEYKQTVFLGAISNKLDETMQGHLAEIRPILVMCDEIRTLNNNILNFFNKNLDIGMNSDELLKRVKNMMYGEEDEEKGYHILPGDNLEEVFLKVKNYYDTAEANKEKKIKDCYQILYGKEIDEAELEERKKKFSLTAFEFDVMHGAREKLHQQQRIIENVLVINIEGYGDDKQMDDDAKILLSGRSKDEIIKLSKLYFGGPVEQLRFWITVSSGVDVEDPNYFKVGDINNFCTDFAYKLNTTVRLKSLERAANRIVKLIDKYPNILKEYKKEGNVEQISEKEIDSYPELKQFAMKTKDAVGYEVDRGKLNKFVKKLWAKTGFANIALGGSFEAISLLPYSQINGAFNLNDFTENKDFSGPMMRMDDYINGGEFGENEKAYNYIVSIGNSLNTKMISRIQEAKFSMAHERNQSVEEIERINKDTDFEFLYAGFLIEEGIDVPEEIKQKVNDYCEQKAKAATSNCNSVGTARAFKINKSFGSVEILQSIYKKVIESSLDKNKMIGKSNLDRVISCVIESYSNFEVNIHGEVDSYFSKKMTKDVKAIYDVDTVADYNKKVAEFNSEIETSNTEKQQKNEIYEAKRITKETLDSAIADLKERMEELDGQISLIKSDLNKHVLKPTEQQNQDQINELQTSMKQLITQLENMTNELNTKMQESETVVFEFNTAKLEFDEATSRHLNSTKAYNDYIEGQKTAKTESAKVIKRILKAAFDNRIKEEDLTLENAETNGLEVAHKQQFLLLLDNLRTCANTKFFFESNAYLDEMDKACMEYYTKHCDYMGELFSGKMYLEGLDPNGRWVMANSYEDYMNFYNGAHSEEYVAAMKENYLESKTAYENLVKTKYDDIINTKLTQHAEDESKFADALQEKISGYKENGFKYATLEEYDEYQKVISDWKASESYKAIQDGKDENEFIVPFKEIIEDIAKLRMKISIAENNTNFLDGREMTPLHKEMIEEYKKEIVQQTKEKITELEEKKNKFIKEQLGI